jgi:D-beta-D-heptose 7-phosphate kinase/D-beta-D-heptose 1-phosphate adenosyltransferase
MRGRRVLVVGDVMLDEFLWGKVTRISPEAPVPVVEVESHSSHLGGAGNVARNIRALGGGAALAGVVGRDSAGERVQQALGEAGIASILTMGEAGRPTTVKSRIVAHHQQVVRADRESSADVPAEIERLIVERALPLLADCQALVVSDYDKGVITAGLLRRLIPRARSRRLPVLVDPKVRHLSLYKGATLVTPNEREAEQAAGFPFRGPGDLEKAGPVLLRKLACEAVLVTRGEHGMSLFERGRPSVHIPTAAREVFDVTGAGDSVIATLALALAAGAKLAEAAALANCAAGVVVGKLGTAVATPAEVLTAAGA